MDSFRPLTPRQSLALAVLGPVVLAAILGLLGHLLGIPAQAGAVDPKPLPPDKKVELPRPPASFVPPAPAAHPLTTESLAGILGAGACEDWPRGFATPSAAVSLRVVKPEGTYLYHHLVGAPSHLEKTGEKELMANVAAALALPRESQGAAALLLVSVVEAAGAQSARLDGAAAAGRAAERARVAAESAGLRARVESKFDPAAAIERFRVPATEVPLLVVAIGASR